MPLPFYVWWEMDIKGSPDEVRLRGNASRHLVSLSRTPFGTSCHFPRTRGQLCIDIKPTV